MIRERKCPFFNRRSFFTDRSEFLKYSSGTQGSELMRFFREETDYDVGMIWENLLRTTHLSAIKDCLGLNYILSSNHSPEIAVSKKIALVLHIYYEDLIEYCYHYALSMPTYSDVFITVGSNRLQMLVERCFLKGPWNSVKIVKVQNRGRDISSLLVGVAPFLLDYDLVCFVHDKKVTQLDEGIIGHAFSERCFQNVLGSSTLVNNILNLFNNEPYLGLLCPPPPNFACYYPTLGIEWGTNYTQTLALANRLNISCPIDSTNEPIAPLGTMFWFRPIALKLLLDQSWHYEDFPQEPNDADGTLLHAIERLYPFVAQNTGYYSAWVLNDSYAQNEWTNLSYMLRNINVEAFHCFGASSHNVLIHRLSHPVVRYFGTTIKKFSHFRKVLKGILPPWLWSNLLRGYRFFQNRGS